MTPRITKFIETLRKIPDDALYSEINSDKYLQPWGFTTYRTYYGPASSQQWESLLGKITLGVKERLRAHGGSKEDPAMITKAEDLFNLDARSDPSTLDGLTLEQVRHLYHESGGGQPMNTDKDPWRVFILADEEVLTNPDLGVIKVVAADYDAVACIPRNPRFGPQRYFGWLKMSSAHVLTLWFQLEIYTLEQVGNHTEGGPGAWWDAEHC